MKTKILVLFVLSLFLFSCQEDTSDILEVDNLDTAVLEKKADKEGFVTVPFKANLSVWDMSDYSDTRCGPSYVYQTMEGNGNITHLGKITTVFTFCVNTLNFSYRDTDVTFVAANGDVLYAEIPTGQILPNDEVNSDYYQAKFNDKMYFVGGTGRFTDAKGEALTNAYVHDGADEWRTDFFSEGYLKLKKGKRKHK